MGYIKSEDHFMNYLNKALRESSIVDVNELMNEDFYLSEIYHAGLANEYTWSLREQGAFLLEESHVLEWLKGRRMKFIHKERFSHLFSNEFIELSEDLANLCGVYCFRKKDNTPLYVGRSIRLGDRMVSSFRDHFQSYNRPVCVSYIITNSAPDAAILELYFISTLNPPFNRKDNFAKEEITLTVEPIPEWSDLVRCNSIINDGRVSTGEDSG